MIKVFFLFTIYYLLSTSSAFAQSVDLLWQGNTYTPPFYKGKTLWSNQSMITLWALPQGLGDPAKLNYKWTKGGTVLGGPKGVNGVGKNRLSFTDSVLGRPQTIKVDIVSTPAADGSEEVLASASVYVEPIPPTLVIYENNPLYGFMFHKEAVGTFNLQEKEVTFTAFPFFFSTSNRINADLSYKWNSNSGEAETRNSVTYRSPDNGSGTSQIQASISNRDKILQSASRNFLIQFGKQ